jgi:glycerate dehydrogenase
MKIVVTDGYALNPGDLDWGVIENLGDLTVYDRTPQELVAERCADADIILTNKTPITKDAISQLANTKLISVLATGYNIVDTAAAREKGIVVCNVPGYSTASVAQQTFALLLELINHTGLYAASVANGDWVRSKDWSYSIAPVTELADKTMGLVGFGNIGKQTAAIASALGMKVLYHTPNKKEGIENATYASLEELFAQSFVVSLHCPLTPSNHKFVNTALLGLMKPTAYLINTSRGQLIDEAALATSLNSGLIAGAGLDVLSTEPPAADNPLLTAKNCIITPHIAWGTKEARQRVMGITAKNIQAFKDGQPVNVVG